MVYLIKDDIMHIKEMIYLNSEARRGLRKYVAAHVSMIDEVRGNNFFSEPIAFSLEDSDIKEMIRPYIMGRIVDVEGFLRRYRFSPGRHAARLSWRCAIPFWSGTAEHSPLR